MKLPPTLHLQTVLWLQTCLCPGQEGPTLQKPFCLVNLSTRNKDYFLCLLQPKTTNIPAGTQNYTDGYWSERTIFQGPVAKWHHHFVIAASHLKPSWKFLVKEHSADGNVCTWCTSPLGNLRDYSVHSVPGTVIHHTISKVRKLRSIPPRWCFREAVCTQPRGTKSYLTLHSVNQRTNKTNPETNSRKMIQAASTDSALLSEFPHCKITLFYTQKTTAKLPDEEPDTSTERFSHSCLTGQQNHSEGWSWPCICCTEQPQLASQKTLKDTYLHLLTESDIQATHSMVKVFHQRVGFLFSYPLQTSSHSWSCSPLSYFWLVQK